jgi:hypothetical protein
MKYFILNFSLYTSQYYETNSVQKDKIHNDEVVSKLK